MRIVLIADTFIPLKTSGAVQLRDLSRELVQLGCTVTVLLPAPGQADFCVAEKMDGVDVIRLKSPETKGVGYVRRTFAELVMPFTMLRRLRQSKFDMKQWDGVIWYAPSIFLAPLASVLKRKSHCRGYLIIRDIFPEWAVDLGLMKRGLVYRFFKAIAKYQYSVADVIGVQTKGNLKYFDTQQRRLQYRAEVLENWLSEPGQRLSSLKMSDTHLKGRKIFVYAGNMGVAQGMDILLDLAEQLLGNVGIGFLFVGRGSEALRLGDCARERKLTNTLFHDEIHPDEIFDLYRQCHVGIVALDQKHRSHNIPGKFLTYLQAGLPVLANVNAGNDLADLIRCSSVGRVCETNDLSELCDLVDELLQDIAQDAELPTRCRQLFAERFSAERSAVQIIDALKGSESGTTA